MKLPRKKIIRTVVAALSVIALATAAYVIFFHPAPQGEGRDLTGSVPDDVICIVETKRPATLLQEVGRMPVWQDFRSMERMKVFGAFIDTMATTICSFPRLSQNLAAYPAIFALRMTEQQKSSVLAVFEVPSLYQRKIIRNFIVQITAGSQITSDRHRGKKLYSVTGPDGNVAFHFAFIDNLFVASTDSILQHMSLDRIANKGPALQENPSFRKAYATTGKMVNTHLLMNGSALKSALCLLPDTTERYLISGRSFPEGWAALDVALRQNEMIFTGFTALKDQENLFYQLWNGDEPEDLKIHKILPVNTAFSLQFTTGNFNDLYRKVTHSKKTGDSVFQGNFRSLMDPSMQVDLAKRVQSIAGPEICLAVAGFPAATLQESTFLIIRSVNPETSRVSLELLSDPAKNAPFTIGDHLIRKLILPNPFLTIFRPLPEDNQLEWYTFLDEYIVFGEKPVALQKFISYFQTGRTIGNNPHLSGYLDHFPGRSNVSLSMNIRNAGDEMVSLLNDSLAATVHRERDFFNRFHGLAIHFSAMEEMLFTTLHLAYDPDYVEESPYLWKTELDTTIRKGPFLVRNPLTGKGNIIVFDDSGQMYLIGEDGEIRWKARVSGPVLSDVFVVEAGHDQLPCYLCNTTDSMYLIQTDGQRAPGFPLAIPSGASNGLTVLDYDNEKEYRIFLATRDRKILNIGIDGNPVKGWNIPVTDSLMVRPMQHLVAAGKDYLIFPLRGGRVLITDRKGNVRLQPAPKFIHSGQSDFYVNKQGTEGIMFTTDVYGNVTYIAQNGGLKKVSFGDFLPNHCFLSADFNGDRQDDYIFLDKNQLSVFNRKREKIAAFSFPEEIQDPPLLFTLPAGRTYLGFFSGVTGNIYLLSREGQAQWTADIKSDRPFQVGYLDNNVTPYLIAGYRGEIFAYLFE